MGKSEKTVHKKPFPQPRPQGATHAAAGIPRRTLRGRRLWDVLAYCFLRTPGGLSARRLGHGYRATWQYPHALTQAFALQNQGYGPAQELEPDAQGRVRIPQVLMREAGLHKDAMLVGMLNKFEIWDQERFNALQLEDVSDELSGLGITLSL